MNIVICMVFGRPQLNFRLSKEAKKLNILPLFFGINYFDFCIFLPIHFKRKRLHSIRLHSIILELMDVVFVQNELCKIICFKK